MSSRVILILKIFLWGVALRLALMVFLGVNGDDCILAETWSGHWFQSGIRATISITDKEISHKGTCIYSRGNSYIFHEVQESCYRCVVLHQRHDNVLQYKESYCVSDSQESICREITGDAVLYSMFRLESQPVGCPFHGAYTFWYNKGTGECREPLSKIDACMVDSRLLLRYQACPDISASESTTEELVCLGVWKEGSNRYMVGKVNHKTANSLEDKYRCFVYEKSKKGDPVDYYVAQSADATCNGLFSAIEGSRTLALTRVRYASDRCRFPTWATNHHRWVSLDGTSVYQFKHRNTSLRIVQSNGREENSQVGKLQCVAEASDPRRPDSVRVVAHVTRDCTSGYVCLELVLKHADVIQIKMGNSSPSKESACEKYYFDDVPYVTLTGGQTRLCPTLGRWKINRMDRGSHDPKVLRCQGTVTTLNVGCSPPRDTLDLRSECDNSEKVEAYSCHGGWVEGNKNYLIVSSKSRSSTSLSLQSLCFINSFSDETLKVGVYPSCTPTEDALHKIKFEASYIGPCVNPLSESNAERSRGCHPLMLIVVYLWLFIVVR